MEISVASDTRTGPDDVRAEEGGAPREEGLDPGAAAGDETPPDTEPAVVGEGGHPGAEAAEPEGPEPADDAEDPEEVEDGRLGPGEERSDAELEDELATLLFAAPEVLTLRRLVELLERPASARVRRALEALAARLEASGLPIVLRPISGGWRLLSHPRAGDVLARLRKEPRPERITRSSLETLAIVAYRQPVTKAEIEAIRGVQSGAILRALVDRGLLRVTGRAEQPGAPLQYGTTRDFLDRFGLASLKDLPRDGELVQGS